LEVDVEQMSSGENDGKIEENEFQTYQVVLTFESGIDDNFISYWIVSVSFTFAFKTVLNLFLSSIDNHKIYNIIYK